MSAAEIFLANRSRQPKMPKVTNDEKIRGEINDRTRRNVLLQDVAGRGSADGDQVRVAAGIGNQILQGNTQIIFEMNALAFDSNIAVANRGLRVNDLLSCQIDLFDGRRFQVVKSLRALVVSLSNRFRRFRPGLLRHGH